MQTKKQTNSPACLLACLQVWRRRGPWRQRRSLQHVLGAAVDNASVCRAGLFIGEVAHTCGQLLSSMWLLLLLLSLSSSLLLLCFHILGAALTNPRASLIQGHH
eukprot:365876-Chlamydomonas_euryale.AAC.10